MILEGFATEQSTKDGKCGKVVYQIGGAVPKVHITVTQKKANEFDAVTGKDQILMTLRGSEEIEADQYNLAIEAYYEGMEIGSLVAAPFILNV
jgi:hypothetical protein